MNAHPKTRTTGFSLIELLIGVAIIAILVGLALPSFQTMLRNTQTRNAAESIQNGLQRARAEAVKLNTNVEFVFVGAGGDTSWEVRTVNTPVPPIEKRSSSEGSTNVDWSVLPGGQTVTFNSLGSLGMSGSQPNNSDGTPPFTQVNLSSSGGDRSLRIVIGAGGNIKMCDPQFPSSNPRGCP